MRFVARVTDLPVPMLEHRFESGKPGVAMGSHLADGDLSIPMAATLANRTGGLTQFDGMMDWPRLEAACSLVNTVQVRKPGSTVAAILPSATWADLGLSTVFIAGWALAGRNKPRHAQRPWWVWIGWVLVLLASALATLWPVHLMGASALGWVVPSLAAILVPIYIFWYQKTDQIVILGSRPPASNQVSSLEEKRPVTDQNSRQAGSETEDRQQIMAKSDSGDLTLSDLVPVISIISDRLDDKGQIQSIMKISGLGRVAFPTGRADAGQLWSAVFESALDEGPDKLALLLENIRSSLGKRSRDRLNAALRDIGLE